MQVSKQAVFVAAATTLLAVAAGFSAVRGQAIIGHDPFYYVELTRTFSRQLPTHFGTVWPYGYPLLGALFVRLGLSPYWALVIVSIASFLATILIAANLLEVDGVSGRRVAFLLLLAAVPGLDLLLVQPASEPVFIALLMAILAAMPRWQDKRWLYASAVLMVAALAMRYAGIFLFAAGALWVAYDRMHARRISLLHAAVALGTALAVAGLLIHTTANATGYASGEARPLGLQSLRDLIFAADLGLDLPGLFSSGLLVKLHAITTVRLVIGISIIGGMIYAGVKALRLGDAKAAAGLLLICYLAGMIMLRSVSEFDIDDPRMITPALPLLFFIALSMAPEKRGLVPGFAIGTLMAAATLVLTVHGVSMEVTGDTRSAAEFLRGRVRPDTAVYINSQGLSLSAQLNATVRLVRAIPQLGGQVRDNYMLVPVDTKGADYFVVIARNLDRAGSEHRFDPTWLAAVQALVNDRRAQILLSDDTAIVGKMMRAPALAANAPLARK